MTSRQTFTEILAGFTTFATMAYILVVNPQILSSTGMPFEDVFMATVLVSAFSSLMMGLWANYPFALAPGLGVNAYFAFGLVAERGIPWQIALGVCFWSSLLLLAFNGLGFRKKMLQAIPSNLRYATSGGIGLFLLFIGFQQIHLIQGHPVTLLTIGDIWSPSFLLALGGILLTTILLVRGWFGAILVSIFTLTGIAWALNLHPYLGLISPPSLPSGTLLQLDLVGSLDLSLLPAMLTFFFIALFDTAGTIVALGQQGNFGKEGNLPKAGRILGCDGVGSIVGALLGSSPVTTYLESGSGIAVGGKTGLTAIVVACLFLLTAFFQPLIASVPLFATAPALILVGTLLCKELRHISWDDLTEAVPAVLTLGAIPMTFSISAGLAVGFISYPIIKLCTGRRAETNLTLWATASLFGLMFFLS